MAGDDDLLVVLEHIRRRGAIGERSLSRAVAHADRFVGAIPDGARDLVDLGSGGGLPGLVIAWRRPQLAVTLVERRQSRADQLHRAVVALGLSSAAVLVADVRQVATSHPGRFDVVTARSFAAPPVTLRWAAALLREGGIALVSEPPGDPVDGARWPAELLDRWSMVDLGAHDGLRHLQHR